MKKQTAEKIHSVFTCGCFYLTSGNTKTPIKVTAKYERFVEMNVQACEQQPKHRLCTPLHSLRLSKTCHPSSWIFMVSSSVFPGVGDALCFFSFFLSLLFHLFGETQSFFLFQPVHGRRCAFVWRALQNQWPRPPKWAVRRGAISCEGTLKKKGSSRRTSRHVKVKSLFAPHHVSKPEVKVIKTISQQ